MDVFLNVAGGMKVSEPAADLAVAAALLSAREDIRFARRHGDLSAKFQPVGRAASGIANRKQVERGAKTWFLTGSRAGQDKVGRHRWNESCAKCRTSSHSLVICSQRAKREGARERMEGFTIVDAGVAVIVLMSAILAYSRGLRARDLCDIWDGSPPHSSPITFAGQAAPLIKQDPGAGQVSRRQVANCR
jgi:hypothetical protein